MTEEEKTAVRKHCGYPAYGSGAEEFQGWRFHQAYGLLEFRMTRISELEQAAVRQYLNALEEIGEQVDLGSQKAAALHEDWRRRLCGFLGVPPGPALRKGGEG